MAKKRKLNSKNPKWKKEVEQKPVNKIFKKEVKGCKIYFIFEKNENAKQ